MPILLIFAVVVPYLLGSIPFGYILVRIFRGEDVRNLGSGNIGATNVARKSPVLGIATLALDALKGFLAVGIALTVSPHLQIVLDGGTSPFLHAAPWQNPVPALAAVFAILGHMYPVWLKFKGGKGVATLMGIVLALHWPIGLIYALVWLGLLAVLRISSVAGMVAAISAPVTAAVLGDFDTVFLLVALALIVLWKHRANVERLIQGNEPRIGAKKDG